MNRSEQYWIERADRRMDGYVLAADKTAKVVTQSYNDVENYIKGEISKILRHTGGEDTLAYEYRMRRLSALLKNTESAFRDLYGINLASTTALLRQIIPDAYYRNIFDIAQGTGVQPEFTAVPRRLVDNIINDNWSGENYSKRIWSNTDNLAEKVREVLTTAAVSGESISRTTRQLADAFNVSDYNARRLIRTETTYAANQAELASYEELDIDRYKYVATLDTRTSSICQKLDGRIFKTKDAKAGVNLPSMHPNCRSTTIAYFDDSEPPFRIAKDKDGKNIKVPASMTYPEWHKKYIEPYENSSKTKTEPPRVITEGNSVEVTVSDSEKPEGGYTEVKIPKR